MGRGALKLLGALALFAAAWLVWRTPAPVPESSTPLEPSALPRSGAETAPPSVTEAPSLPTNGPKPGGSPGGDRSAGSTDPGRPESGALGTKAPEEEDEVATESQRTLGLGEEGSTRGGAWILDPEVHQRILRELPEDQTLSYLLIRVRKLSSATLRLFPTEEVEARRAARGRVREIHRRLVARKREAAGDPVAVEALREDLIELDRSLEQWRIRVLAGEPAVPALEFQGAR